MAYAGHVYPQGFPTICLSSSDEQENPKVEFHDHSTIFGSSEGPKILAADMDEYRQAE